MAGIVSTVGERLAGQTIRCSRIVQDLPLAGLRSRTSGHRTPEARRWTGLLKRLVPGRLPVTTSSIGGHRDGRDAACVVRAPGTGRAVQVTRPAGRRCRGREATIIAVDIVAFGDRRRDDEIQLFLRDALYGILENAFVDARVPWRKCHREDCGDGALIVLPPDVPTATLINPLIEQLRTRLRLHNKMTNEAAKIRLRMAAHLGVVYFDDYGVAGTALVHLFRLLDAPSFKRAMADAAADFGLVASERLYDDVIRTASGTTDPDAFHAVAVTVKETRTRAWLNVPTPRIPPGPAERRGPVTRLAGR